MNRKQFFLVLPADLNADDCLAGSEGEPEFDLPNKALCRVAYDLEKAEIYLLDMQKNHPDIGFVLLESIAHCKPISGKPGEYKILETVNGY